jgi:hypothetical protein
MALRYGKKGYFAADQAAHSYFIAKVNDYAYVENPIRPGALLSTLFNCMILGIPIRFLEPAAELFSGQRSS